MPLGKANVGSMHTQTLTYRIQTLGCRVNHAECRQLEAALERHGLQRADAAMAASIEVVHSCAVTSRAAAKSRNAARRARRSQNRHQSGGLVLVTGCLAADPAHEHNAQAAGGHRNLIGHESAQHKGAMIDRFNHRLEQWLETLPASTPLPQALPVLPGRGPTPRSRHVRAELKIQDGCDAHCTFCIIPKLRSTLRSKPLQDVVEEAGQLVDAGHVEIVLTGIFIGAYGHETAIRRKQVHSMASPLADLLDAVAAVPGLKRLRLSSMEPGDVDEPLLDAMVAHPNIIVPHLHLPLQSGSDAILRRMNRQYDTAAYRAMLMQVHEALTSDEGLPPALTTDIICGFPGETDADMQATVDLVHEASYLHMHVFPYSPRPGTAAARWTRDGVPTNVARARVRQLIDLETRPGGLREQFQRGLIGRTLRVILEQPDQARPNHWLGRCDHYARVSVQCAGTNDSLAYGNLVRAIPMTIDDDVVLATLAPRRVMLPVLKPIANEGTAL